VSEFTPEINGEDDGPVHAEGCVVRGVGEGDRVEQFGRAPSFDRSRRPKYFSLPDLQRVSRRQRTPMRWADMKKRMTVNLGSVSPLTLREDRMRSVGGEGTRSGRDHNLGEELGGWRC